MSKPRLTAKQAAFVGFYLANGMNATKAATSAGYSKKTAYKIGSENLTKPQIADAIGKRQAELAKRVEITQQRIADELALMGFANMLDFIRIGSDGDPFIDLTELTREQAAALTEANVEDYLEGRGDDARNVRRVRIKLADKRAALGDLAKLLGLIAPKRIEHTGADGGPIETRDLGAPVDDFSTDTLLAMREDMRAAKAKRRDK